MKPIAITPHYTKGTPIDVIACSLERAAAVAEVLALLHSGFGEVEAEPEPHCVYMLSTILGEHVGIARQALDAIIDEELADK